MLPSTGPVEFELEDPRVGQLVHDQLRLVVLEHPGGYPRLARLPRLEVVVGVDPSGGERRQDVRPAVVHLDRDVVVANEVAQPIRDLVQHRPRVEGRQDRLGDLEQLALVAELALEDGRLLAQALGRVGVDEGLGREAGVDLEEAKVVVAELVQPELREDQDSQDLIVERHRREQHRLVEVVLRARDGLGPWVGRRVAEVLGHAVRRDPAGDPDPDPDPELLRRLVDVLADLAAEGDRHQVVTDDPVDPDVVIVDELTQLGGDRQPDLALDGQPVQPTPELLDRLELRRPGGHPGDVVGGRRSVAIDQPWADGRAPAPSVDPGSDPPPGSDRGERDDVGFVGLHPPGDRTALRCREEPLEVAQPVAPVAARVDPVIAKPTLIAPRPDGVGVDAEQSGRLGHGKGGIRRAIDEQRWQSS